MVGSGPLVDAAVLLMRLVVFGLALGLTVISFQSYREQRTERLQFAFLGFAFISMGVALSAIVGQLGSGASDSVLTLFRIAETVPFVIGFVMFYLSLYR
jgi:heme/copper-type cytochrome/quinol oxidase subunit 4